MNGPRTEWEEFIGYSRKPDVRIRFELNYDEDLYPDLPAVLDAGLLAQLLHISKDHAFVLLRNVSFPTIRLRQKRLLVQKEKVKPWMMQQGLWKD